jgi:hypothetical protein
LQQAANQPKLHLENSFVEKKQEHEHIKVLRIIMQEAADEEEKMYDIRPPRVACLQLSELRKGI